MYKFVLSTDSTCDLYHDFVAENDIRFVSLTYTMEKDGVMTDGLDAFTEYSQYVDFYDQLRAGGFSRTSMLNYESHYSHFLKLAKEGAKDVLHFTISSGLSPTVTVAEKAAADIKKDYPDFNLLAVDSLSATIGQGALVRAALRLRNEGKTVQEAYDYVVDMQKHIQYAIFANDLYYLKRGGRVSAVAALAGTMLKVKPALSFTKDGKLIVVDKIRGMKKAFAWALEKQEKFPPVEENRMMWVVHTDAEKEANELAAMVEERWNFKPDVSIMGPVIGSHVGPGAVAVIWTSKEERQD
ncbi:MAG TPA: DegV family protein [Candidatus Borkfalkia excrementavium]|uniref:DegV family protein n=1 Tax=Candidatus Borkfalkia excrementavium TaxID=2838505 RepID=A0A9D2CGF5_9FIRM|nr:DegV family protein [Candidatus Borkfalkia excrementavium]